MLRYTCGTVRGPRTKQMRHERVLKQKSQPRDTRMRAHGVQVWQPFCGDEDLQTFWQLLSASTHEFRSCGYGAAAIAGQQDEEIKAVMSDHIFPLSSQLRAGYRFFGNVN